MLKQHGLTTTLRMTFKPGSIVAQRYYLARDGVQVRIFGV
jgi:hypothetical protein